MSSNVMMFEEHGKGEVWVALYDRKDAESTCRAAVLGEFITLFKVMQPVAMLSSIVGASCALKGLETKNQSVYVAPLSKTVPGARTIRSVLASEDTVDMTTDSHTTCAVPSFTPIVLVKP